MSNLRGSGREGSSPSLSAKDPALRVFAVREETKLSSIFGADAKSGTFIVYNIRHA